MNHAEAKRDTRKGAHLMTGLRVKDTVTGQEEIVEANGLVYAVGQSSKRQFEKWSKKA